MFIVRRANRFKKDSKLYRHNKEVLVELEKILAVLIKGGELPARNANHRLSGDFKNYFDCHIKPDVILVYEMDWEEKTILLLRIGSHSELF